MSRAVFAEYGNMSSPTVLFVLDRLRKHERAAAVRRARASGRDWSRKRRCSCNISTSDIGHEGATCPPIHSRREWLAGVAGAAGTCIAATAQGGQPVAQPKTAFGYLPQHQHRSRQGRQVAADHRPHRHRGEGRLRRDRAVDFGDRRRTSRRGGTLKDLRKRIERRGAQGRRRDRLRGVDRRGRGSPQEGTRTGEARHGLGRGDRQPAHRRPAGRRDRRRRASATTRSSRSR